MRDDMIRIYDDVLDYVQCQSLIRMFESRPDLHERKLGDNCFTELDITAHHYLGLFQQWHEGMVNMQIGVIKRYIADCGIDTQQIAIDPRFGFENFRVKRYNEGQGFPLHTDEGGNRRLACLYYLNSDFVKGYTSFPQHNLIIEPRLGGVVVFPATWEYIHEGFAVQSGKKYLMSSYLVRNATRN